MERTSSQLLVHVDSTNIYRYPPEYQLVWLSWLTSDNTFIVNPRRSIQFEFDPYALEAQMNLPTNLYVGGQILEVCVSKTLLRLSELWSIHNGNINLFLDLNACYANSNIKSFYKKHLPNLRRKIPNLEVLT